MGYQALLFCPDDKLARVLSQVFTELDFIVEPVHEPFGAVKKLMSQRFDAIVVDCENEQNATLLFKSARNSSSNQSSLAIAVVEGQAGVAKAYRIGANLVLTKPINVEQAKGTLRVARGLLRKNSEVAAGAATPAMPAKPALLFGGPSHPASEHAAAISPAPSRQELPEFETPDPAPLPVASPAATAPAAAEDNQPPVLAPVAQNPVTAAAEPSVAEPSVVEPALSERQPASADAGTTAAAPVKNAVSAFSSAPGAASAPAPAKETATPAAAQTSHPKPAYDTAQNFGTTFGTTYGTKFGTSEAASFEALGEESSGSGSSKKILIAAVVILALAAIGYFGYEKFGKSGATPSPAAQHDSGQLSVPAPAPLSTPTATPVATSAAKTPDRAGSTPILAVIAAAAAPSDKSAGNSAVTRIDLGPESAPKKLDATPIRVKSNPGRAKTQGQTKESAPSLPDTLAAASADNSNLSGLMSSASSAPKPSLATLKVSQGVSQGLLIKRVPPRYPPAALAVHTHGEVQIEATINKEGNVVNPKVLSGDPVLAKAALDAVRQWRYKPYYLDGEPVEIQTQITIRFKAE